MADKYKEDHPGHPLHNFYTQLRELERKVAEQKRKDAAAKPKKRVAPTLVKKPTSPKKQHSPNNSKKAKH
jgi:hypothetical protein